MNLLQAVEQDHLRPLDPWFPNARDPVDKRFIERFQNLFDEYHANGQPPDRIILAPGGGFELRWEFDDSELIFCAEVADHGTQLLWHADDKNPLFQAMALDFLDPENFKIAAEHITEVCNDRAN